MGRARSWSRIEIVLVRLAGVVQIPMPSIARLPCLHCLALKVAAIFPVVSDAVECLTLRSAFVAIHVRVYIKTVRPLKFAIWKNAAAKPSNHDRAGRSLAKRARQEFDCWHGLHGYSNSSSLARSSPRPVINSSVRSLLR